MNPGPIIDIFGTGSCSLKSSREGRPLICVLLQIEDIKERFYLDQKIKGDKNR